MKTKQRREEMIMRIVLAGLLALTVGCATTQHKVTLATKDKVFFADKSTFQQDEMVAKLPRGPRVVGETCEHHLFALIPVTGSYAPDLQFAFADAIDQAGPPYDALKNAELRYRLRTIPYVWRWNCYSAEGTATMLPPRRKARR